MGLIYCLYATEDGQPRYIGQTTKTLPWRLAQHAARARWETTTPLYSWIRAVHQAGFQVLGHAIQPDVGYADLDRFERYWMAQLTGLLNVPRGGPTVAADTLAGIALRRALRTMLPNPAIPA